MEKERKRDWVESALDQWDRERQTIRLQRLLSRVLSSVLVTMLGTVVLSLFLALKAPQSDVPEYSSGQSGGRLLSSERESLQLAQNRVLG